MVRKGTGSYQAPKPVKTTHHAAAEPVGGIASEAYIAQYQSLKTLPRAEEALQCLRRIGAVVRPLMKRHKWRLPLLAEFMPKQENLLGVNFNGGQKISLRLRYNHLPDAFIDEESVIHTMLHELTHNVRGPHDEVFFKFLQELTEEYWELKRKGFVDFQAFEGRGRPLGLGNNHHDVPPHLARQRAGDQAERRRKLQELGRGGGRLGTDSSSSSSSSTISNKTPAQLAAKAAERRRIHLAGSCPDNDQEYTRAEQEAEAEEAIYGIEVITIEDDEEPDVWILNDHELPPPPPPSPSPAAASERATKRAAAKPEEVDRKIVVLGDSDDSDDDDEPVLVGQNGLSPTQRRKLERGWSCSSCELRNERGKLRCAACDTERPRELHLDQSRRRAILTKPGKKEAGGPSFVTAPKGWQCTSCRFIMAGDLATFWVCRQCGDMRPPPS